MKIKNFNERKSFYKHIKDAKNLSYDYDDSDSEIVSKILQENKSLMLLNPLDINLFYSIKYSADLYKETNNINDITILYKNILLIFELLNEINPTCDRVHLIIGHKCINRRKDFLNKKYSNYFINSFFDYSFIDGLTIGFIDLKNNLVYLLTSFLDIDNLFEDINKSFRSLASSFSQKSLSIVENGYKITKDCKIEEITEKDLDDNIYSLIYFKTGLN